MIDPWTNSVSTDKPSDDTTDHIVEFEDNFMPDTNNELPDSQQYLETLEKKLEKLRNNTKPLEELAAKREACMERLLRGSIDLPTASDFGLDENCDLTKTREILRHIIPQQPLHPGELISIIKYDQFEPCNEDETSDKEQSDLESR